MPLGPVSSYGTRLSWTGASAGVAVCRGGAARTAVRVSSLRQQLMSALGNCSESRFARRLSDSPCHVGSGPPSEHFQYGH